MKLDELRELLIDSIHSDLNAKEFFKTNLKEKELVLSLCAICAPYDKYSNDCRMEAAYYLSKAPEETLGEVVPLLSVLLTIPSEDGEDMNGNIAIHLLKAIKRGLPHFQGTMYHELDKIAEGYSLK